MYAVMVDLPQGSNNCAPNNVNVGGIQIIINNYGGGYAPRHHGHGYGHYLPGQGDS